MADERQRLESAARRFLADGARGSLVESDLAAACDSLVRRVTQSAPTEAVGLARSFVKRAEGVSGSMHATALRALGWALRCSDNFEGARDAYLAARVLQVREPEQRARIDRILVDVCMYLDDLPECRRRASMAIRTFKRLKLPAEVAKTQVNLANVLHRQDRHREARKLYRSACRYFETKKDEVAVAQCYYNLANTLVQLFEFDHAIQRYSIAERHFRKHGFSIYATHCRNGIAWMHLLQGKYHIAMHELETCRREFESAAQQRGEVLCLLDLAELFLALNLFGDAERCARTADTIARRLDIRYESAKASLFLGKSLLGQNRTRPAINALDRALQEFELSRNQPFQAACRLARVQVSPGGRDGPRELESISDQFRASQLPLWAAITDLVLLTLDPGNQAAHDRLRTNKAAATVPHLLAQRHTLLGDRAAEHGRMKTAVRHWSTAADTLDAVRASLPPLELRSSFIVGRADPYERLIEAERHTAPLRAAGWSERHKTAGPWSPPASSALDHPVRTRAAESLAKLAAQVHALGANLNSGDSERSTSTVAGSPAVLTMQRRVRGALSEIEHSSVNRTEFSRLLRLIQSTSVEQPLVQLHVTGEDLLIFIHESGATRVQRLKSGLPRLTQLAACWRFLMARMQSHPATNLSYRDPAEEDILRQLGDLLWSPLELSQRHRRVVIIPDGMLWNLPWQALMYDRRPIGDRHRLVLTPSVRHHRRARSLRIRSRRIRIFIGDTTGLPHQRGDYKRLRQTSYGQIDIINPCSRDDWPIDESAWLWHYSGHATLRVDNPFYSSLRLHDGPLFAADFRLRTNRVALIVLAACRTAQQTALPGAESSGFVRSLLEMGARNVLASHWAVSDLTTSLWMNEFYSYLIDGKPAGAALQAASRSMRERCGSAYHWAAFSLYGAG